MACLLAGLAAACQPVPRPFQPAKKRVLREMTVDVSPRAGLVVTEISGLPSPADGETLRQELATALQRRDFVASAGGGHSRSHWLQGDLRFQRMDDGAVRVDGVWVLLGPDGTLAAEAQHRQRLTGWEAGATDPGQLKRIAAAAAREIDAAVRRREGGGERRAELPPLSLAAISGLARRDEAALAGALVRTLTAMGLRADANPTGSGHVIRGQVMHSPRTPYLERITLVWRVFDGEGHEIGRIEQANDLPTGRLDRPWGRLAQDVAEGAAQGIVDLLRRRQAANAKGG